MSHAKHDSVIKKTIMAITLEHNNISKTYKDTTTLVYEPMRHRHSIWWAYLAVIGTFFFSKNTCLLFDHTD
jgi:hypothetical protein